VGHDEAAVAGDLHGKGRGLETEHDGSVTPEYSSQTLFGGWHRGKKFLPRRP
jgi:hypothetical protein